MMQPGFFLVAEQPQPQPTRFAYSAVRLPILAAASSYIPHASNGDITVDVHSHFVLVGYAACIMSLFFCIGVVLLPPGPTLPNGALRYISEGLDTFCGWTVVVMGTSSMLILVVQLVASAFMRSRWAAFAAVLQAVGWNAVAGVSSTGWDLHHVALVVFLASSFAFNWIASNDVAYGGRIYRTANISSLVLAILFNTLAMIAEHTGVQTTKTGATMRSFAVAFEFALMFSVVFQTLCLVRALDSYHLIHLRFERR